MTAKQVQEIRATDLFVSNPYGGEVEVKRLEGVRESLTKLSSHSKRNIVSDLLKIVADQSKRPWTRVQACIVIGGRRNELGIAQSKTMARQLRRLIQREFLVRRPSRFFSLKRAAPVRRIDVLEFTVLQALAVTQIRLDPRSAKWITINVIERLANEQLRSELLAAVSNEKEKGINP